MITRLKNCVPVFFLLLWCGCALLDMQASKREDKNPLAEAQKAFDDKAYVDAINLFQDYIQKHPKSKDYTIALQRLGESFEGLLDLEYKRRMDNGAAEPLARKEFLAKYGHYNCWQDGPRGLHYNKTHFKTILEKYPDSPIADEAAYRMIVWEQDYKGRPEGLARELQALEEIFKKYPTTSLRPEILYEMAHRCHILYEMYSFSPVPDVRNQQKAQEYKEKALFLYQLSLSSPEHSKYSEKTWKDMDLLQKGVRIYQLN